MKSGVFFSLALLLLCFFSCISEKNIVSEIFTRENSHAKISVFVEGDIKGLHVEKIMEILDRIAGLTSRQFSKKGYDISHVMCVGASLFDASKGYCCNEKKGKKYSKWKYYPLFVNKKLKKNREIRDSLFRVYELLNTIQSSTYGTIFSNAHNELIFRYSDSFMKNLADLNRSFSDNFMGPRIQKLQNKFNSDLLVFCKVYGFSDSGAESVEFMFTFLSAFAGGIGYNEKDNYIQIRYCVIDARSGEIVFFSEAGLIGDPMKPEYSKKSAGRALKNFPRRGRPAENFKESFPSRRGQNK